ncbi:hypothetical protein SLS59_005884 [Nothophoma quercina]|uniref:RCHY1 zinc-ribbon domain-containing protein n=1 Tax=Nothophoma quercina TaxID=749835 RepID=A0ABR3R748_9PLEO
MSSNPSRALEHRFRSLDLDPPVSSAPAAPTAISRARPGTAGQNAGGMSESLPADDGFTHLRARIHEIRALKITEQERAQMIHGLMIERYNHMRPTSPSSFVSHDRPFTPNSGHSVFSENHASSPLSAASDLDTEKPYKLRPGDTSPTYRTIEHQDEEDEEEDHEEELVLGCRHYKRNVKCPICKKSAVKMDLQWRKLTSAIEAQPMPEQFENTRAIVQCNDCSRKSSVKYHWLGNQCENCDSYNTNELRILNGPDSEEAANTILDADANSGSRSPASVSSPQSQALRSPRYYFQPDEPEETWLPGQLPSFPFQMPNFPGRPRMPDMPQMPRMPGFPSLPQFPQFPNMPRMPQMPQMPQMRRDAEEMLERFRRSMDAYLNPTGEVRDEHVPFIDLGGDDRRETTEATDGTQVKGPYLPQYYFERFSQALTRFRNELNPGMEEIPDLNLSEDQDPEGLQFWGEDGGRLERQINADDDGDDGASDDESSSDESHHEEEDDDDEDDNHEHTNGQKRKTDWDLPGHL